MALTARERSIRGTVWFRRRAASSFPVRLGDDTPVELGTCFRDFEAGVFFDMYEYNHTLIGTAFHANL